MTLKKQKQTYIPVLQKVSFDHSYGLLKVIWFARQLLHNIFPLAFLLMFDPVALLR